MNDDRLTRRAMLAILVTGLITAVIALAATFFVVGSAAPSYTAKALLALVPGKQLAADQVPSYWESLAGGQAGSIAAQVLQQDQWRTTAAQAAGVSPASVTVTAGVVQSTQLINLTVTTTTGPGAEAGAAKIITDATPLVQQVSGPFELITVQPAAGTAVPSNIPATQLYIVVFIGGLLVGAGAALIVVRARNRSDDDGDYYPDSGEFRAVAGSGYGRPVGPPVRQGPPPMMNGSNGAYGPPPRRPVGDPRAQPPRG